MKKLISISLMLAGLLLATPSLFAQQYFYPQLKLTCTESPVFEVSVYGIYTRSSSPTTGNSIGLHYSNPGSKLFTPLNGPANETYQLNELTIGIGGSSDATFSGTELWGTAKPLGTSGRTAYVYLVNPGQYSFYIY